MQLLRYSIGKRSKFEPFISRQDGNPTTTADYGTKCGDEINRKSSFLNGGNEHNYDIQHAFNNETTGNFNSEYEDSFLSPDETEMEHNVWDFRYLKPINDSVISIMVAICIQC